MLKKQRFTKIVEVTLSNLNESTYKTFILCYHIIKILIFPIINDGKP